MRDPQPAANTFAPNIAGEAATRASLQLLALYLVATVLPLLAYPTMEYKGIHYSVVQTLGAAFKWTVRLANGERIGVARDRTLATLHAIKAIDEDERQIRAAF